MERKNVRKKARVHLGGPFGPKHGNRRGIVDSEVMKLNDGGGVKNGVAGAPAPIQRHHPSNVNEGAIALKSVDD